MPKLTFSLKGDPSTFEREYPGHLVAEAVLMSTLLEMGHVMSDVAEWGVDSGANPCECKLTNDAGTLIHSRGCPNVPMPSETLDDYPITDGMRVWNYDLDPGTVKLADRDQEYHTGDVWFEVVKDGCTRGSSFNGTRTWKYHPTTRREA